MKALGYEHYKISEYFNMVILIKIFKQKTSIINKIYNKDEQNEPN